MDLLALERGLADQVELAALEVAQPAVDQLGAATRRARREVVGLEQRDREPAHRRVADDPRTRDATADHDQIVFAVLELADGRRARERGDARQTGHDSNASESAGARIGGQPKWTESAKRTESVEVDEHGRRPRAVNRSRRSSTGYWTMKPVRNNRACEAVRTRPAR